MNPPKHSPVIHRPVQMSGNATGCTHMVDFAKSGHDFGCSVSLKIFTEICSIYMYGLINIKLHGILCMSQAIHACIVQT